MSEGSYDPKTGIYTKPKDPLRKRIYHWFYMNTDHAILVAVYAALIYSMVQYSGWAFWLSLVGFFIVLAGCYEFTLLTGFFMIHAGLSWLEKAGSLVGWLIVEFLIVTRLEKLLNLCGLELKKRDH